MAALMKHESSLKGLKIGIKWAQVAMMGKVFRFKNPVKKPKLKPNPGPTFDSAAQSLAARGFLRAYKGYTPAESVEEDISALSTEVFGTSSKETKFDDPQQRFKFLHACWTHTGHPIPNSLLHTINSVEDAIIFYKTPVNINTPLDMFKEKELPPNLHIQYDYKRFDQDPDNRFGGHTAFPESTTFVTGLKARKKYKTVYAKPPVHDWMKLANWPYPIKN